MKHLFIRLGIAIIGIAFILLQFFQPQKNNEEISSSHILTNEAVPNEIATLLQQSCFDCHSNATHYLWYHRISPVSLMVDKHIQEGKKELNFSDWADLDVFSKITMLEKICRESKRKTMPLKSYATMHPKAKLSEEELDKLCNWSTKASEELLKKASENED